MVINGTSLVLTNVITDMEIEKHKKHGVSFGLSEAGYDIRIKQEIAFKRSKQGNRYININEGLGKKVRQQHAGRFAIASTIEHFNMPTNLVGVVHDKSTWARKGLSVFNTVIEPGWKGYLTLELVYHGEDNLLIPAGAGIAQVLFHSLATKSRYTGKYQDQEDRPVEAIESQEDEEETSVASLGGTSSPPTCS